MNNIQIGKKTVEVKGSWTELDKDETIKLAQTPRTPEGRLKALVKLLPPQGRKLLGKLTDKQLYEAATLLTDFLFKPLTAQNMPAILLCGKMLRGVTSNLGDMRFIEFIKAEALVKDGIPKNIDKLCGLLYRFEEEGPFDDGEWAEKEALFAAHSPSESKYVIAKFYLDCRETIIQKYSKTVFKTGGGGKGATWGEIFHQMIEKPSDVESLANEPLHNVLLYLSKDRK